MTRLPLALLSTAALTLAAVAQTTSQDSKQHVTVQTQVIGSESSLTPAQKAQLQAKVHQAEAQLQSAFDRVNQAGCPVHLTSASPDARGHLVLAAGKSGDKDRGGIDLEYRNYSGKPIRSIEVAAYLKVKQNKYQLDSTTDVLHLTLHGTSDVSQSEQILESVPLDVFLYGINRVELEKVSYADGTSWTPPRGSYCSIDGGSGMKQIAEAK
jgi:hypothetical protein